MRIRDGKSGNAAVVVILLLLVGGVAAWWFLFREEAKPQLPPPGNPVAVQQVQASAASGAAGDQVLDAASGGNDVEGGTPAVADASGLPMTPAGEVDWNARRGQLVAKFSGEFNEPKIGMNAKILLSSGKIAEGRITDLTPDAITLRVTGTGKATYSRSQISGRSQVILFKDAFVNHSAERVLAEEKAARGGAAAADPSGPPKKP